jgi:hypothetical protein
MNVIICQTNSQRLEGVLLAAGKYRLRVMLPGAPDVTELNLEYGQWTLETGEPVELESFVAEPSLDLSLLALEMFSPRLAAGARAQHHFEG